MSKFQNIIESLPYSKPFLFVDSLSSITESDLEGSYTFSKDEYFYAGHFNNYPVTPGVILTECMAQIGLVCFGVFLLSPTASSIKAAVLSTYKIALTNHNIDFYLPVFPGERVRVLSHKEYFRFNKLKCTVKMLNEKGEVVCRGVISGMISE